MTRTVPLVALAAALGVWQLVSQPRRGDNIRYQPGAYFPEGFPLQGTVKLLSPAAVAMGERTRVEVEYTVGATAIEPGMSIEVWKHFTSDVEELQAQDAAAPAHFAAQLPATGVEARTEVFTNWVQRNTPDVFPYRKCARIEITRGVLRQGDRVRFDIGGARGVRMQHYEENLFNFRFALTRGGRPVAYAGDAILRVTGGKLARLRVQAPSVVKAGEAFPLEVVPMDEWVSLAPGAAGLRLAARGDGVTAGELRWDEALGHYITREAKAARAGVARITVETVDGRVRGESNPIWVEADPVHRAWFGELHQHTYLADGRGVFDELYLYGRRVGLLDFGAVTPHHMPLSVTGPQLQLGKQFPRENWPELQRVTKAMNGWQGFVSLLGYEYSVGTAAGGHHNVFFNADEARSTMQLDPKEPAAPVGKMLETVKLARVPTLVIPHIGGGPPDWSHPTDQRIERLFEVASVHGVFEESWERHLRAGQRQGVIGAGDTHTTSMGIAYPGLIYVNSNGLAGVWAYTKSRQDIWDGLYQRRTFATTGNQRMLVDFRVNGEPLGGEIGAAVASEARLDARVSGTSPLLKLEFVKNGKVIHAVRPARATGPVVRVVWGDNLYQRRAATGLREGEFRAAAGRVRLDSVVNRDQAFETVTQRGDAIAFKTAAVSGDRDGFLASIAEATGDLTFRLDDADTMGVFEVRIPLEQLKRDGFFAYRAKGKATHPYMEKMGVEPAFFLECELVDPNAARDHALTFVDRTAPKPGDYYYLRVEQLDTNKAWSSPVWVN